LTFDSASQLLDERKRSLFLTVIGGYHDPHKRYDLVVPETTFADPRFQALLEVVRSPEFQKAAAALGGYDLKDCGTILWEQ